MTRELTFRILLEKPPAGTDFGLQKGRGIPYETVQKQRSVGGNLQFEFTVQPKPGSNGAAPNLLGPFVQGPPDGRFVYLDIGGAAGQFDTQWRRRLKIPLSGIPWDAIKPLAEDLPVIFETHIPGTGKDGGPTCGTVKPFAGWKLASTPL
jgi:hypothetical protein